jgi:hypothetical protein
LIVYLLVVGVKGLMVMIVVVMMMTIIVMTMTKALGERTGRRQRCRLCGSPHFASNLLPKSFPPIPTRLHLHVGLSAITTKTMRQFADKRHALQPLQSVSVSLFGTCEHVSHVARRA